MKNLLLLIVVVLMFIGSNMPWIERPVLTGITSFHVSIIPGWISSPSFGILSITLSIFLLVSLFIKRLSWKLWPGIAGVMLSILFFIHVAFLDPARFKIIYDEVEAYRSVMGFSKVFLPPNLGIEPVYNLDIQPDRIIDRLQFTWHIIGWGWFIFLGAAMAWLLIAGEIRWFKKNIAFAILLLSVSLLPFAPYTLSKYYIGKANADWAEENYSRAVEEFVFAKKINPALGYSPFYSINLGRMYYYLGRGDNPYYYLYSGMIYAGERRIEDAEDAYLKAIYMDRNTPSSVVFKKQYADLLMTRGMDEFRKSRTGDAIANLRKALEITPDNFMAQYVLGKVLFDTSQYEQAILINKNILQISVNPLLNSNVNANIGDCYSKLGEHSRAREYYETSLELKTRGNFRAFEDLGGT